MTGPVHTFEEHRALLFGVAYRMTGSAMDAEDLVQEAYLRWLNATTDTVRSPRDYLVTTITRLAIDYMGSARVRREEYVGPWLPEPLVESLQSDPATDPEARTQLVESLQTAFLVVLETLSPVERAAFLLHEVFGYGYDDLAKVLAKSEESCRQIIHRARERVRGGRPRFESSPQQLEEATRRFIAACAGGSMDALLGVLAPDVVFIGDGGGKVENARRPVRGATNVARLLLGLLTKKTPSGMEWSVQPVNGQPAIVFRLGGEPYGVLTLAIAEGRIQSVYVVNNPEKLRQLAVPRPTEIGHNRTSGDRAC